MPNFAIHIHLYLTSKDTELIAYNNLKKLKKAGFKIIITSPKKLPEDFYDLIDFFFYDKENQLFTKKYEGIDAIIHWYSTSFFTMNFLVQQIQNHALAVLRSMIKGCKVAKAAGFDYIIRFEYDDLFGRQSLDKIKQISEEVHQNNYDFYLYKNNYGKNNERSDVSVHLMFYKCDSFLSVFESIKNEEDYNIFLENFGIPKKAIILEEFVWMAINKSNFNIHYEEGSTMTTVFNDSTFNIRQVEFGIREGVLSDVMLIADNYVYRKDQICLVAKNQFAEDDVDVYFDIFDLDGNLINTIHVLISYPDQWYYNIIENCKNIGSVKIRHNKNESYKNILVYREEDQIKIRDTSIIKDTRFSEIFFN